MILEIKFKDGYVFSEISYVSTSNEIIIYTDANTQCEHHLITEFVEYAKVHLNDREHWIY